MLITPIHQLISSAICNFWPIILFLCVTVYKYDIPVGWPAWWSTPSEHCHPVGHPTGISYLFYYTEANKRPLSRARKKHDKLKPTKLTWAVQYLRSWFTVLTMLGCHICFVIPNNRPPAQLLTPGHPKSMTSWNLKKITWAAQYLSWPCWPTYCKPTFVYEGAWTFEELCSKYTKDLGHLSKPIRIQYLQVRYNKDTCLQAQWHHKINSHGHI